MINLKIFLDKIKKKRGKNKLKRRKKAKKVIMKKMRIKIKKINELTT